LVVSITQPGQAALVTFSGAANQLVNLGVTNDTIPGCYGTYISILKPDGSTLTSGNFCTSGDIDTQLTVDGTYTLRITSGTQVGNLTLTLSEPVLGTMTIGGDSLTTGVTRPGQDARVTFSGSANQLVSLGVTNVTIGGSCTTYISIFKPDGSTLL